MAARNRILVLGSGLTAAILGSFVGEEHGFQMTVADNIDSAQSLFDLADADVIVLDWELEQASYTFRQLRQTVPSIPVIIIASTPLAEQIVESAVAVLRHSELPSSFVPVIQLALHRKTLTSPVVPLDEVPFGIVDACVTIGQHFAMFWKDEAELATMARFFSVGLEAGDYFILAYPQAAGELIGRVFERNGIDATKLESQGRLRVIKAEREDIAVSSIIEAIQSALSRGAPLVRLLGHVAGWQTAADEHVVIESEAAFEKFIKGCRCVAVCPYRVNAVNGGTMLKAALRTHKSVIFNGSIVDNPFYLST